jgi:hypothetical protein
MKLKSILLLLPFLLLSIVLKAQNGKWSVTIHSSVDVQHGAERVPIREYFGYTRERDEKTINYSFGAGLQDYRSYPPKIK